MQFPNIVEFFFHASITITFHDFGAPLPMWFVCVTVALGSEFLHWSYPHFLRLLAFGWDAVQDGQEVSQ